MPRIRAENISEHKERTAVAILDAAEEVFVAKDLSNASISDIADSAGVGRSTIYDYFRTKDALFVALLEDRVRPLVGDIVQAANDHDDPVDGLLGLARRALESAARHRVVALLFTECDRKLPEPERAEALRLVDPICSRIRTLVEASCGGFGCASGDCVSVAQMVSDVLAGGVEEIACRDEREVVTGEVIATRLAAIDRVVR